jgi:hypothetical protein
MDGSKDTTGVNKADISKSSTFAGNPDQKFRVFKNYAALASIAADFFNQICTKLTPKNSKYKGFER